MIKATAQYLTRRIDFSNEAIVRTLQKLIFQMKAIGQTLSRFDQTKAIVILTRVDFLSEGNWPNPDYNQLLK